MWKFGCAISGLAIGALPMAAAAQSQTAPAPVPQKPAEASPAPAPTPAPTPRRQARPAAPAPASDADTVDDDSGIVVSGQLRGAVVGDIQPEQQLTAADVRAYGVSSISDLLTQLAPQTYSGRGRGGDMPVVLLNGRRISSFSEIRDLPTEAIERVDILPEEVALKYGYRADQRVVNIVLRARFRSLTTELTGGMPTQGGNSSKHGAIDVLKISRSGRLNVDMQYTGNSGILESERDVLPQTPVPTAGTFGAPAGSPNFPASFAPYRTLVAPSQGITLNTVYARTLSPKVGLSINARLEDTERKSWLGLPGIALTIPAGSAFTAYSGPVTIYPPLGPLTRGSDSRTAHLGFTVNGDAQPWRWSVTGNYDHVTSQTVTDTGFDPSEMQALLTAHDPSFNPFATLPMSLLAVRPADLANSMSSVGSLDAMLNGPIATLPAGKITTTFRATAKTSAFDSSSLRSGLAQSGHGSRQSADGQVNLDIPITSRRENFLSAIGDLSLNGNVEVEHLSDFGSLLTTGYGAHWSPIAQLRFLVSVTDEKGAPSPQQLADPTVFTPNVRVFDLVRGESVDITTITGGNPLLSPDHRHVMKLGLSSRPIDKLELNLTADYVRSTTRNQISSFPTATPELEGAFPSRFTRDASGRLTSIDMRPVNFERADRSELHWGFSLSIPVQSSVEKRVTEARDAYLKARDEAERTGQPAPSPQKFFGDLATRYGTGRPNLGNSIFGGPILQGGQGGRGQGGRGPGGQASGTPAGQAPAQGGQAAPATQPPPGQTPPAQGATGDQTAQGTAAPGGGRGFGGGGGGGGGRGFGGGGGGGGGFGGGRGGFGGANSPLSGRIQVSFYHTWHFRDQVLIHDGLPILDVLNGSASGSSGGEPRHELDLQAGYTKNGIGARLIGHWQSATDVDGGATGTSPSLHFSSLGTVGVRLFADLGQQIGLLRKHTWVLGTRVALSVDNVFDSRIRVRDAAGATPLSYQPDLLDPTGRTIRLTIRKLFY